MFSDEKGIPALILTFSLAATECACSGLRYSGSSDPVFSMLVLATSRLQRHFSIFIDLFRHIHFGWIVLLFYAQRYFLHNTNCCSHGT